MDDSDKLDFIYRTSIEMHGDLKQLRQDVHGSSEQPGKGILARVEKIERYINYIFGGGILISAVAATIAWFHDFFHPGIRG